VAGDIQVTFDALLAMPLVESGLVRALGMTGLQRSPFAPSLAPIAETLPGYEGSSWLGLFLPAGTPAEVVQQLRTDWIKASALPEVQKGLAAAANTPLAMSSDDFVRLIQSEAGRWRDIATRGKIVLD
jgi:tripartite-type tricarboxylate transporter receptor subunit TctC